jgi:hypothetical protein
MKKHIDIKQVGLDWPKDLPLETSRSKEIPYVSIYPSTWFGDFIDLKICRLILPEGTPA